MNDANIRIAPATIQFIVPSRSPPVRLRALLTMSWKHNLGARKPVAIDVSSDGAVSGNRIARTETKGSDASTFEWTVDVLPTNRARLRIRALDGTGASAMSDVFTVST